MTTKDKPYRCFVCGDSFSQQDVELYNFFRSTKTCFQCYWKGKKEDHQVWCFGKRNKVNRAGRVVRWGYDGNEHVECREECPDRKICPLFLTHIKDNGKKYTKIGRARKRVLVTSDSE